MRHTRLQTQTCSTHRSQRRTQSTGHLQQPTWDSPTTRPPFVGKHQHVLILLHTQLFVSLSCELPDSELGWSLSEEWSEIWDHSSVKLKTSNTPSLQWKAVFSNHSSLAKTKPPKKNTFLHDKPIIFREMKEPRNLKYIKILTDHCKQNSLQFQWGKLIKNLLCLIW